MSDHQSPQNSSTPQKASSPGSPDKCSKSSTNRKTSPPAPERTSAQTTPTTASSEPTLPNPIRGLDTDPSAQQAWETVALPGTLPTDADDVPAMTASAPDKPAESTSISEREAELLTLIHDLNECNDVLLTRIAQLEGQLDKTQTTLKTEVEKALLAKDKLTKQVCAEQAAAQQVSKTAQNQIAKLVSQVESGEQALIRQQFINENIQIELANNQERIVQLERECALVSQQHAEAAQARVEAERDSRDLRSRLQRQQRYTMQFKAALEKSLTVSHRSAHAITQETPHPLPANPPAAVTMPKAQRIMPWVAAPSSFQGIDPNLEMLIRKVGKSGDVATRPQPSPTLLSSAPTATSVTEATTQNTPSAADLETEEKLWQDLERVVNNAAEAVTDVTDSLSDQPPVAATAKAAQAIAEPKLNWQEAAAQKSHTLSESSAQNADEPKKTAADIAKEKVKATACRPATAQSTHPDNREAMAAYTASFTEPCPWDEPLSTNDATTALQPSSESRAVVGADAIADASISPVVKPLSRQKKRVGSMAAVKLPTFERAKAGSFRR